MVAMAPPARARRAGLHRTRKLVTAVTVRLEKRTVKSGARVESVCTMGNEGVELGCGAREAILAHLTLAGTKALTLTRLS